MRRLVLAAAFLLTACGSLAAQNALSRREQRIRAAIAATRDEQVAYLQRVVDIPSATLDLAGVRRVGEAFRASFDSLGFRTTWVQMPAAMGRAGHLVAEHRGRSGKARILLIGHFDTVLEPTGPTFVRQDSLARGTGSTDMKGGDVVILYALKALQRAGALKDLNITAVFTGDEEDCGEPRPLARQALTDAARHSDVSLAFEGGTTSLATIARRGISGWRLTTTGKQAHSAGIFSGAGYGAVYEMARILDAFRAQLAGEQYLTFNAATLLAGTDVAFDTATTSGTAASKTNIVPRQAVAAGDLRFISPEQLERTRLKMREIVARHLPGTDASITFSDGYPSMPPTEGNSRILAVYDTASQALGYGPVTAMDPGLRGAGDISFVAPFTDGLEGLGSLGEGDHSPDEWVNLKALPMQTERAALTIARLGARPARQFAHQEKAAPTK